MIAPDAAPEAGLAEARAAAAELLAERGYHQEAAIVARGAGDDFAEVRMALGLLRILERRTAKVEPRFSRRLVGGGMLSPSSPP